MNRLSSSTLRTLASTLLALVLGMGVSCSTIPPANHGPELIHGDGFSHELLNQVQQRFVDERGRVDYTGLQADPDALERYYKLVAAHSPDLDPQLFADDDARLTYWINAYNAAVLKAVITHYPIETVGDVKPPTLLFFMSEHSGFFYFQQLVFGGKKINLYNLENDIIRPRFSEPRIHFAINCASLGCPRLPTRAFTAAGVRQQLQREAVRFFDEDRNLRVDDEARVVYMSSLLSWYEEDFLGWLNDTQPQIEGPTLLDYARFYQTGERLTAVERAQREGYEIRFEPYDWRLNDQAASY